MSTCRALRHPSAGNVPADNLPPEKLNNSCNHPSVTDELKIAAGYSTPFFPCPSKASDPNPQMARFLMNEATATTRPSTENPFQRFVPLSIQLYPHVPRKYGVVLGTKEMDHRREKSDAPRAFHVTPVEDMGVDVERGTLGVGF